MMPVRDPAVAAFLVAVADAFDAREVEPEARRSLQRIADALRQPGELTPRLGRREPVCQSVPVALAAVADRFAAVEPRLVWAPRASAGTNASANFRGWHANAMVAGPGGLEERPDLPQVTASL